MGGREYAALADGDAPPTLEAALAVIAAGALALPAFSAQGGPWRGRIGTVLGALPAMAGARSALASLYCALATDDLLDRLGADGPVVVDGPFARNPVYLGALAGLRGDVGVPSGSGAAAGAARLARWGAGPPADPAPAMTPAPRALDMAAYRARWRAALRP
jgi:sugar (pentulose or hexulose) kinase